jgi:hypothetical protein
MRSLLDRSKVKRMSRVPESDGRPPHFSPAPLLGRGLETAPQQGHHELAVLSGPLDWDEMLVVDPRSSLRPAQQVERKLMALLKSVYLPVSHVRTTTLYKGRGPFPATAAQSARTLNGAAFAYAGQ